MKKIIFLVLISVGFKVSADQFWIDPRSSIFSDAEVGPHIPAASFVIRDLNPGFRNGMTLYFADATATSAARSFKLAFFNSLGQRVCTNGQLSPAAPNECFYSASLFTQVLLTLSSNIYSVKIGSGCNQNCMSQVDEQNLFQVYTSPSLVNNGQVKKICPNGQEVSGPFFAGDHVVVSAQIEPGLTCEGSELWINNGDTKIGPTATSADAGGFVKFDISSLSANTSNMYAYISGRNSVGQIKEIGSVGINFPGFFNPTVYTTDIFQVIKNPILFTPSNVVDLVAGKNADIILETNLIQSDITGTVLEWKNKSGVVEKVFPVKSNQTDATGKIIFEIDPVPKESEFVGGETQFSIKLMLNNGCGSTSLAQTIAKTVHIRKTKPIRLEFTKIIRPSLYASPTETLMNITKTKGVDLTRITFPVADTDFSVKDAPLPVIGLANGQPEIGSFNDWWALNTSRNIFNIFSFGNNSTHLIGFVSNAYLQYNKKTWLGVTKRKRPYVFIKEGEISTLPHELTHTYCVRFDNKKSCIENGSAGYLHSPTVDIANQIYSNYSLTNLQTNREELTGRKNLMFFQAIQGVPEENGWWFDEIGYLQLFYNNLENRNVKILQNEMLNLVGAIDSNGRVNLSNIFLSKNVPMVRENKLISGEYRISFFDRAKKLIFTEFVNSDNIIVESVGIDSGDNTVFDAEVQMPHAATTIEISRNQGTKNESPVVVVLPIDIILDSLKYIPDFAYKIDKNESLSQMTKYLYEVRGLILKGQTDAASNILKKNFLDYIQTNIKSDFQKISLLDVGLLELQNMLTYSIVKLDAIRPPSSSPFFEIVELSKPAISEKSKIQINLFNQPTNPENLMVLDVYFNNNPVSTILNKTYLTAESGSLSMGVHNWQIRTYIVSKKMWNSYENNIRNWQNEKAKLHASLDVEVDLNKIESMRIKILDLINKISFFQSEKNKLKSELGQPVNFNIEVQ